MYPVCKSRRLNSSVSLALGPANFYDLQCSFSSAGYLLLVSGRRFDIRILHNGERDEEVFTPPSTVSSAHVWNQGGIFFSHPTIMFGAALSTPLANHRHVPTPASSQDQNIFDSASVSLAQPKKIETAPTDHFPADSIIQHQ